MNDDAHVHRQSWELMPWIANGSATQEQRRLVQDHLPDCPDCRDELALQQRIHDGMNDEAVAGDPQAALQRLLDRIDAPINPHGLDRHDGIDDDDRAAPAAAPVRRRGLHMGIAALLLMQSAGLLLMAYQLQQRPDSAAPRAGDYRTLSRADQENSIATIRFVPAPELTVMDLQKLLDNAQLRIVDSRPGSAIYGLAPVGITMETRTDIDPAAIALLRGKPGVLLVEPIARPTPAATR